MKPTKSAKPLPIPFHHISVNSQVVIDGEKCIKVRSKTAMTPTGKVLHVPDAKLVRPVR